jgi:hypothetical protein
MTDDIVARLRRHARVPFEKIERKAAFDAAKRVVKQRNVDIVDRLRAIVVVSGGFNNANVDHIVRAADEIERLRARVAELEAERAPAP